MSQRINFSSLQIDSELYEFVNQQVLPQTQVSIEQFWQGLEHLVSEFAGENQALLQTRATLQEQIDSWHQENPGAIKNQASYKSFLSDIGYLQPLPEKFNVEPGPVDSELALLAGPQLVVPATNARFVLNAANARWGSLYDALYGSDIIEPQSHVKGYDPVRGLQVIEYCKTLLDNFLPLASGSHSDVKGYAVQNGNLQLTLRNGMTTNLEDETQFVGFSNPAEEIHTLLFRHNNLHIELEFDPRKASAKQDNSGLSDIVLEAALSTIIDCEDSVSTVDAQDKIAAYKNWLQLNQGTLEADVAKGNSTFVRKLASNREYTSSNNKVLELKGRSLLLVRNVGHLTTTDAVLTKTGEEIPEGILDALVTSTAALHDRNRPAPYRNSSCGNIYIVKPKMHGPQEVAFTNKLFSAVEGILKLEPYTLKMGLMDEERRTSLNLAACVEAAKNRVVFINTGFLDRTGDEIHTSIHAGPFNLKASLKQSPWLQAYEKHNVATGLAAGMSGRGQIGKGMWAMPDLMAKMINEKGSQLLAGANTAWVPSPTAATLHAIHYHQINVPSQQQQLIDQPLVNRDEMLAIDVVDDFTWSQEEIQKEIENNIQGILGYVVRWIDQGVGCSKVPDISDVALMEDRATLRISSQHIANWLLHKVCSQTQVEQALLKMAEVVDKQNQGDSQYQSLLHNLNDDFTGNLAMEAAYQLIFDGVNQPSGYTEPLLHSIRRQKKSL